MKAYFSYINSRKGPDGKRGVYGRQIVFKYYDDGYNPANSIQLTRRLVEEDKVFAVVGLARDRGERGDQAVPQRPEGPADPRRDRRVASFADAKKYPWTGGWQPAYDYESRIYGQAIAHNSPNAKIAVLYQNDDFGKENLDGLKKGLGAKASNIVAAESHEVTAADVRAQVAKLRGVRRLDLRHLHDAEVHDPVVRDRERAQVGAGRDLHDVRLRDGRLPDAREELGRR